MKAFCNIYLNFLVQEIQAEGRHAIDSPGNPNAPEIPPEDYALAENEQRAIIQPQSFNDPGKLIFDFNFSYQFFLSTI